MKNTWFQASKFCLLPSSSGFGNWNFLLKLFSVLLMIQIQSVWRLHALRTENLFSLQYPKTACPDCTLSGHIRQNVGSRFNLSSQLSWDGALRHQELSAHKQMSLSCWASLHGWLFATALKSHVGGLFPWPCSIQNTSLCHIRKEGWIQKSLLLTITSNPGWERFTNLSCRSVCS